MQWRFLSFCFVRSTDKTTRNTIPNISFPNQNAFETHQRIQFCCFANPPLCPPPHRTKSIQTMKPFVFAQYAEPRTKSAVLPFKRTFCIQWVLLLFSCHSNQLAFYACNNLVCASFFATKNKLSKFSIFFEAKRIITEININLCVSPLCINLSCLCACVLFFIIIIFPFSIHKPRLTSNYIVFFLKSCVLLLSPNPQSFALVFVI